MIFEHQTELIDWSGSQLSVKKTTKGITIRVVDGFKHCDFTFEFDEAEQVLEFLTKKITNEGLD